MKTLLNILPVLFLISALFPIIFLACVPEEDRTTRVETTGEITHMKYGGQLKDGIYLCTVGTIYLDTGEVYLVFADALNRLRIGQTYNLVLEDDGGACDNIFTVVSHKQVETY